MPRYIDADDLFSLIQDCVSAPYEESREVKDEVLEIIAEKKGCDVQEVVHCKDCIHRDPEDKKCDGVFCAKNGLLPMDDNDYCSYGERKK